VTGTYGIATILKILCGNNHNMDIILEYIDKKASSMLAKKVVINYKLLLFMQLLGKGLKTILIVVALLGLHVALDSAKNTVWIISKKKLML